MLKTRREFLRRCSFTVTGVAILPCATMAAPGRRASRYMPLQKLSFQTFASQLNSSFQVKLADASVVPLKLVEVTRGTSQKSAGPKGITYEQFSLVFTGPLAPSLDQRVHALQHERIGQFDVFMVPVVSRDTSVMHYECIFNRPLEKSAAGL